VLTACFLSKLFEGAQRHFEGIRHLCPGVMNCFGGQHLTVGYEGQREREGGRLAEEEGMMS